MTESALEPKYDVVLLVEQALTDVDAQQVVALHEELDLDQEVVYHVLIPVEDAAARVEAALGSLAVGDVVAAPTLAMSEVDLQKVRQECEEQSADALSQTLTALRALGVEAEGEVVHEHPVDGLISAVTRFDGREAIILTRQHLVAEFFHVDWTSRARRKLGVPVLHLLEHESTIDQGSGGGEGITGL